MLLGLSSAGCRAPDPQQELELIGIETYWAIDSKVGDTNYLAPVVRFQLRNKGTAPHRAIRMKAAFRRVGERVWAEAFRQVSPVAGQPLAAGASLEVVFKPEGEGRYKSPEEPEAMLKNPQFKDVTAEVFAVVGRSSWSKLATVDVERRIGSRTVQDLP